MKKIILKIKNIISSVLFDYEKYIPLFWFTGKQNFGDEINLFLVESISRKRVKHIVPKYFFSKHYLCIGSILERANKNSVVWGSGYISENSKVTKPKKIYAVRGPRTRNMFLKNQIDCPEIYGDPALLLPKFYKPTLSKKYEIGVVAHYVDKDTVNSLKIFQSNNIKIIDIQQENHLNFIEELNQCKLILSSSLHGLIVSDAYGIENIWIKLSEKLLGDDFKFYDYFESVNRLNEKPYYVDSNTLIKDILENKNQYKIDIDLEKLLHSCPFYTTSGKI